MKVNHAAGKILLALYVLQLENVVKLGKARLQFTSPQKSKLEGDTWLKDILRQINADDSMIHNALNYLLDEGLIHNFSTRDVGPYSILLYGIRVSSKGIRIVENIEKGDEQRKVVKSLFSFNFSNNVTVDSLVKAEVGNIVGIGAAVGGKIDL